MEVVGPDHRHRPGSRSAVTIGAYDGVHLGHRAVLGELRGLASERNLDTVVVTFDRHPASVVRPESAPYLLTDLPQKLDLLADCGVDRTLVLPFDRRRADETAEEFIAEVLVEALGAQLVVVGTDFHFGHGRKGNVALLREQGAVLDFEVVGFGLHDAGGTPVSSTRIRELVANGDMASASGLLGRDHEVRGTVVRGDGRGGSLLGMPTANVDVPDEIAVPGEGIYAGWYTGEDPTPSGSPQVSRHPAAISVGRRPTFYGSEGESLVEVHLLDFSGDLYDQPARVTFHRPVRRGQVEFPGVDELVAQMRRDVEDVRRLLGST
jgi:riboflavin kinase / FMN adenylyltransferase